MTERKPAGVSFESWIDAQIRVARENGAFDNLPGAGKPLSDAGQPFDPDWWVKQLVKREQIDGVDVLPPQLNLLKKVGTELAAIEFLDNEATVRQRLAALNAEIVKVNSTVIDGPPTRLAPLNVERVVSRWRNSRAGMK
jgi:hypothetical protein